MGMRRKIIVRNPDPREEWSGSVWGLWELPVGFAVGGPVVFLEDMAGCVRAWLGSVGRRCMVKPKATGRRVVLRVPLRFAGALDSFGGWLEREKRRTLQPVRCFRRLVH